MTLADIFQKVIGGNIPTIATITILLMTFIQVTPIKVNPWSWLARRFGKAINHDIMVEVDEIKKDVQELRKEHKEDRDELMSTMAFDRRNRILIFADELRIGIDHSEEYFNQILEDCDEYTKYCNSHPDYTNSKAVDAIALVKEVYHKCKAENKFI